MNDAAATSDVWSGNTLGLDGSRVIDRTIYSDPRLFEAEQEELFAKTWQWIAHESELREFGDYVTATIAGRPVVVARGEGDVINAFYNTCTHRGAILAAGQKGNCKGSFTCLYHAWCFDTEGKLASVPKPEAYGAGLKKGCYDIPKVRVEVFAGNIFINLDPKAEPLADYLGAVKTWMEKFTADWEALGRVRWVVEGNWKLWHENFRDNYHPMFAHQLLTLNYQGVKLEGENHDLRRGHSVMHFPPQGNPANFAAAVRRLTGKPFEGESRWAGPATKDPFAFVITAIFPNLDFQYGTTGGVHSMLQTVRPLGINRAVVEMTVFGPKGESVEDRQVRLESALDGQTSAGKISGDDNEAARRCSVGFGALPAVRWSNMDRGQEPGFSGSKNDEYSLRGFYAEYKRRLGNHLAALVSPGRAAR